MRRGVRRGEISHPSEHRTWVCVGWVEGRWATVTWPQGWLRPWLCLYVYVRVRVLLRVGA